MCYGHQRSLSPGNHFNPPRIHRPPNGNELVIEDLRGRLAQTEARLERARALEAELSRRLEEMKRFVSVIEILENYLNRRFREQQEHVAHLFATGVVNWRIFISEWNITRF
ncbi:hypothetical protein CFOL_v3_13578 [Cephalotus follicularis]|uniref:Protein SKIP34 n=1 Tax=Cephalotus follicularis TaxID=3775 RepID=A0A1Q3BQA7_CEPFO|nr:hypothetical protein CFOL_v3_13578 [Cephalotus follicularis]